uniref:Uncharacterized protein n=1 Tax=Erpetoichthys calabaricus TaxID=27687 RepID=A0A8C4T428_ERPCA
KSTSSLRWGKQRFTCSVCLSPLTDPITIPCGHSFCLQCLADYWDQRQECRCPQCASTFATRPELHINTVLNEVVKKIQKPILSPLTSPNYTDSEYVECDACTGRKSRASKSCLTCMISYCHAHLQMEMEKVEEVMEKLDEEIEELEWKDTDGWCGQSIRTWALWWFIVISSFYFKFPQILSNQITVHSTHLSLVSAAPDWFLLIVYFCPLTLDINTTNKHLHLSEGNKKVTRKETEIKYPDHPDRFEWCPQVLCREALTGTRCYWEVECSGCCMRIGVTYEGLGRNECYWQCGLGENEESWCLICSNNSYHSVQHNDVQTEVDTPYSPRLGVYLDWPAGSLSFYSVSHTMTLLHRLNTSFTKPLYPGFWLGMDASITICPLMMSCDH